MTGRLRCDCVSWSNPGISPNTDRPEPHGTRSAQLALRIRVGFQIPTAVFTCVSRKDKEADSPQKPQKDKKHKRQRAVEPLCLLSFCEFCGESRLNHLKTAVTALPGRNDDQCLFWTTKIVVGSLLPSLCSNRLSLSNTTRYISLSWCCYSRSIRLRSTRNQQ